MDETMERSNLGPYQVKPRSKPYTPLIFRILMKINVLVLLVLLLLGLRAVFYVGAHTSLPVVHQPVSNTNDGKETRWELLVAGSKDGMETLDQQYEVVRMGTVNEGKEHSAHVSSLTPNLTAGSQLDASLLHFWHALVGAPEGSKEKIAAQKQLLDKLKHRVQIDESMLSIAKILFESEYRLIMETVRPASQPVVDDWICLQSMMRTYEERCGSLSTYGWRYAANMCNAGVKVEQMAMAAATICHA